MNWFLAFVGFFAILTEIFSLSWHNFRQYFNPSELYFVIETYEHAVELFPSIDLMNKIAIIWVTYDHEVDPYLKLYVEYVLELTKYLDSVHVIIKNPDNDASLLPKVMEILPDKNIFIIVEDADLRINLCSLFATLDYLSRPSPIIFHLNHETPWVESTMGVTPTGHYCSSYLLEDIYKKYLYVFRNYYSILYTSSSDYVPLLSKQMRKLRQYRNQHPLIKSSQRMNWCIFSGRIKYDHTRVVDSIFRSERLHFIHLISAATNPGNQKCVAYYNNDGVDGHQHSFNEYMDVLSQSVFTPCPAGNSPETFRHYEALELGSIPIFIRPPADVDFLSMWFGYPGPIFESWEAALEFISSTSPSEADLLQEQLIKWYEGFRENISTHFSSIVKKKFGMSPDSILEPTDVNSVLKTNAPVSSAIRWLHLSQQRYKTNQNTISLEQRIDSLTNELTKLTEEQHKIINLLHDLSNRSSVSIIPQ